MSLNVDLFAHAYDTTMFSDTKLRGNHAGIRRNIDNDLVEDDLLRVGLGAIPQGATAKLFSSAGTLRVWKDAQGRNALVPDQTGGIPVTASMTEVWVDYASPGSTPQQLRLEVDPGRGGQIISDSVTFTPFDGVIVLFGGRHQSPKANPESQVGMSQIAFDLLKDGYNVYFYGHWQGALGFAAVRDNVQRYGVQNVGLMGYSWGGGTAFQLAYDLDNTLGAHGSDPSIKLPFDVEFTGYMDAYWNDMSLKSRPRASKYHMNLYEDKLNWDLSQWGVRGAATYGADVNYHRNEFDHLTIDDNSAWQDFFRDTAATKVGQ